MKRIFVSVATLISGVSFGQTLADGIRETTNERHDVSENIFQKLIASNPTNPELYFYQAENFLAGNDVEEAKATYKKAGESAADNNYAKLAKAKLAWINGDTTCAGNVMRDLLKATKRKNPELMRQMAVIYSKLDIKNTDVAIKLLENAIAIDGKNQENYLLLGDAQIVNPKNASAAMKSYNLASDINNDAKVMVRKAQLYQRAKNPKLANEMFSTAIEMDPNYAPTYRAQAELNMEYNQFDAALPLWEKYIKLNDSEKARYRYASSLFAAGKFQEALTQINQLNEKGFSNAYTLRIEGTSIVKLALKGEKVDVQKGKEVTEKIFANYPKLVHSSDYETMADFAKLEGDNDKYKAELNKAIEFEKTPAGKQYYYGILADFYLNTTKEYALAAQMFEAKRADKMDNLTLNEYQEWGRALFASEQFEAAEKAFDVVIVSSPNYAGGYFWKARTVLRMDTNNEGLAIPHYEKVLSLISPDDMKGGYKAIAVESASYLGTINHIQKNMDKATEYFTLVQSLDPTDEKATAFFKLQKK